MHILHSSIRVDSKLVSYLQWSSFVFSKLCNLLRGFKCDSMSCSHLTESRSPSRHALAGLIYTYVTNKVKTINDVQGRRLTLRHRFSHRPKDIHQGLTEPVSNGLRLGDGGTERVPCYSPRVLMYYRLKILHYS